MSNLSSKNISAAPKTPAFNFRIGRQDRENLDRIFNPGPGTYQNVKKCEAFKYDFISKDDIN